MPPEPSGPFPAGVVEVRQLGTTPVVGFTLPRLRGSRPAQEVVRVELLRVSYPPGVLPQDDPDVFRRRGQVVATLEGDPLATERREALEDARLDDLAAGGVESTLRYAVRVHDRRGRPSRLVYSQDLVLLPGAPPPTGVEAEPTADGIRLRWSAPPAVEDARFNVYRASVGSDPPAEPRNTEPLAETEFLDSEVVNGETYVYTVRVALASDRPFREGQPSEPREVLSEDRFAPATPRNLVSVQEGLAIRLFWDPNRETDVAGYRVYRSVDGGAWTQIGPDPLTKPLYLDNDVLLEQRIVYRVTAMDRASPPNESGESDPTTVSIAREPVTP